MKFKDSDLLHSLRIKYQEDDADSDNEDDEEDEEELDAEEEYSS